MSKIVTYFSVGTAAFAFVFSFNRNIIWASITSLVCLLLLFIGFKIEKYIKTNTDNQLINKCVYFLTKNDEKYNIKHKRTTYTYNGNGSYTFTKKYEIVPTIKDLDRMNDRFAWSAPSSGCAIDPTNPRHHINRRWQKESWTCYSIYFGEMAKKNIAYSTGAIISNLKDESNYAVPFLSNTIDKKTACVTLEVIFPKNAHPKTAKFEIFSSDCGLNSNHNEELSYDSDISGFQRTVYYPRKGWRYVISWDQNY